MAKRSDPVSVSAVWLLVALWAAVPAGAQTPPDEHAQHHPPAAPGAPAGAAPGGEMSRMMERMGPVTKELYPALMDLPDLPLEKRAEVQRLAHERMTNGARELSEALEELSAAVPRDDYAGMQDATARMRQALAQFESGLAAHRALAEGKAPRSVALQWFKREMNLLPPPAGAVAHGFFGLSAFHYVTMAIMLAFSVVMAAMYFARMRRAAALAATLSGAGPASGTPGGTAPTPPAIARAQAPPPISPVGQAPSATPVSTTGSWSGQVRVARIFQETPDVKTFRLAPLSGEDLPFAFEPGQFLTVAAPADGKVVKRSYSLASSPCCRGWCEITVKRAPGGVVSSYLHERIKVGDLLEAAGPYGRFTFRGHEAPSVVMIGGGVGITPLMSSLRYLTDQSWSGDIHLIYACSRLDNVIFREELDYLARRHPNLHVTLALNDEPSQTWAGARGYITAELLARTVPDLATRRVHLCGPPPMMVAVKQALAQLGVAGAQIHTELFLSPEVKPAPPRGAEQAAAAGVATCSFARSSKKAPLPPERTVLEAAEGVGVAIDYVCRQGFCGVCKIKLLAGEVSMEVEDGLSAADKAASHILACQARAQQDVTVDA